MANGKGKRKEKNTKSNKELLIISIAIVNTPCQGVAYGLSNGSVVFNPINVEDPVKISFFEPLESQEKEGLIKLIVANPR